MTGHNVAYPWLSYYGNYDFFESRMRDHRRVLSLEKLGVGHYRLTRHRGAHLDVFICDCYAFCTAELVEATENLGHLDVVIVNLAWCGYSDEVKLQGRRDRVGIFNIKDFMASLYKDDFLMCLNQWDTDRFEKRGFI